MKNLSVKVGVIGFGSFGKFLVDKLEGKVELSVYDPEQEVPAELTSSLENIGKCKYVVLAIPAAAYDEFLPRLKSVVNKDTVIVDISSVKVLPFQKILDVLPDQKRVIMHPLFGPQSAADSFEGHKVVMCPDESTPESYVSIKRFVQELGLEVVELSAEEHDRQMALVQGLTFFVARALVGMDVHDVELMTPSFKKLLDLADLEKSHTNNLFLTIQNSNPYAEEVRRRFVRVVDELNIGLGE
jgi:prephenate dehydrogenase